MPDVKVEIRGIRELSSALKKVDKETSAKLRSGMKDVAENVASAIKPKVPFLKGKARSSIKPRATVKGAGIAFGGTTAPYFPWLDFGGRVGRQKHSLRPVEREGRYVYPTIKEKNEYIKEAVDDLLEQVIRNADFDSKGGE